MRKESLFKIFAKMPIIETERLRLRPMRVSDAPDMFDYARRPEVTRYLLWSPHPNIEYTKEYLEYLGGRYRLGMHHEWAVVLKESERMIGTCGFANIDCPHNCGELGYVLHPDYHGKGLITEAAQAVLEVGFSTLALNRIEVRFMAENAASRRVSEKLGMQFEGVRRSSMLIKGAYRDIAYAAILAKDYRRA